jgi:hypothetical protein
MQALRREGGGLHRQDRALLRAAAQEFFHQAPASAAATPAGEDRQADDGEGTARPLPYQAGGERPVEVAPPAVVRGERMTAGISEEAVPLSGHHQPETCDRHQAPELLRLLRRAEQLTRSVAPTEPQTEE